VADRIAELIILAEDLLQANFARRYLQRAGHRNLNIKIAPSARGSGEQFVRENYPTEMQYYRQRSHHRRAGLVVVIDADVKSVNERQSELERALTEAKEAPRGATEMVAVLIPKRNVETWILCLTRESVDEVTDYSDRDLNAFTKEAAEIFYEWSRPNYTVPESCIPSLNQGLQEIQRIR
jgi:hypothetical protein